MSSTHTIDHAMAGQESAFASSTEGSKDSRGDNAVAHHHQSTTSAVVAQGSNDADADFHRGADTAAASPPTSSCPGAPGTSNSQQRQSLVAHSPPQHGSNLIVRGLPPTMDDSGFAAAFSKFGPIVSAKVMLRVSTGISRGFGFVLFKTAADADAAQAAMDGGSIPGHVGRLEVSVSKHRGENLTAESRVVYVRNVPSATDLPPYLTRFGEVERHIVRQQPERGLVTWLVTFTSIPAARECVRLLHGRTPSGEPAARGEVALLAKMEEPQTLRETRRRAIAALPPDNTSSAPAVQPATTRGSKPNRGQPGHPRVGTVARATVPLHHATAHDAARAAPQNFSSPTVALQLPPPSASWPQFQQPPSGAATYLQYDAPASAPCTQQQFAGAPGQMLMPPPFQDMFGRMIALPGNCYNYPTVPAPPPSHSYGPPPLPPLPPQMLHLHHATSMAPPGACWPPQPFTNTYAPAPWQPSRSW